MNVPTSVTEGRVTVTANDTEDSIREQAGFSELPEMDDVPDPKSEGDTAAPERDETGKFKAKPAIEEPAKVEGNPRKSFQAKIDLAIRNQREAERERDAEREAARQAREELDRYRQPKAAEPPPQPVSNASRYIQDVQRYQALPDAPKFDDFVSAGLEDPYTAHRDAMAIFVAEKRYEERATKDAQDANERRRNEVLGAAFEVARERHADTEELLKTSPEAQRQYPLAVTEHLKVEAALDPETSADLIHHLLTHPDDAAELQKMTNPVAASREIGRLIGRLSSATPGPETSAPQTTAKPLIKPVRSSVATPGSPNADDLPFGPRYIALMNEQDRKARANR